MSDTMHELSHDVNQEKKATKPVIFMVAEHGLETEVDEVLSKEEFDARENFEPNRNWSTITVANEADKNLWVGLRNEWLECAWTANQDDETRKRNAQRMREIEQKMREIENKARKSE